MAAADRFSAGQAHGEGDGTRVSILARVHRTKVGQPRARQHGLGRGKQRARMLGDQCAKAARDRQDRNSCPRSKLFDGAGDSSASNIDRFP